MAAGGDYEKLSSQFLECPLCFEQFVSPKVLPCQHTFCLGCLRRYMAARGFDNTIPCPVCKDRVIIPGNDVSNFKSNFMIVSLLQFIEDSKKSSAKEEREMQTSSGDTQALSAQNPCGACSEPGTLTSFCQLCTLWLCAICTKAHSRLPSTSTHPLMSNEEVDRQCKAMVDTGINSLTTLQQANTERQDCLTAQQLQLPENVNQIKRRIESAAEEAHKVIRGKADSLLEEVDRFEQDQRYDLTHRLNVVAERKTELSRLLDLLETVKLSNDGFQNQTTIKSAEQFVSKSSVAEFSSQADSTVQLAFNAFSSNLTELKSMEMGQLRRVVGQVRNCQYLLDRPLRICRETSLSDQEYITALAINKFADKFVVANNQKVLVFKPDSRHAKPFISQLSERNVSKPWGIAYCETDRCILISQSGRHEGDGSVIAYSYDGSFQSTVASGLTLPRGIAVQNGRIFVCDQIDRCVYILNMSGKVIRVLKKTPDGKNLFNGPMFISVGMNGTIAVSDNFTAVRIFDKDCGLKFTYTSSLLESQFWDVHVMQNGTVVVCDWKHGLHKISPDFSTNGLVRIETNTLREPSALAALENGNSLYVGTCGGEIYTAI